MTVDRGSTQWELLQPSGRHLAAERLLAALHRAGGNFVNVTEDDSLQIIDLLITSRNATEGR